MFDRIVVGYDDSEHAHDALALAAALARADGGRLDLVAVIDVPSYAPTTPDAVLAVRREEVAEMLAAAPVPPGVDNDRLVLAGSPAGELTALSEAPAPPPETRADPEPLDLVVIGASHRSAGGRLMVGSVAEILLHGAGCPVAVASPGLAARDQAPLERIGVAFDGTPESAAAAAFAADLAAAAGATLQIITVADTTPFRPTQAFDQVMLDAERAHLGGLAEELETSLAGRLHVERTLREGLPSEQLVEAAGGLDLLITGSRCYGPVRRVLLGSTSTRLVREAPCPLLVVPRTG